MKILVTGGAGFIGSHIAEYLVKRGDDVTVLDNLKTGEEKNLAKINDQINFVNGDIRDYKLLEKLINGTTGIFHEAALASVPQSFCCLRDKNCTCERGENNPKIIGIKF